MSSHKYFGTDGIRLTADQFTPDFLGAVLDGLIAYAGRSDFKILLGGDTRISTSRILTDLFSLAVAKGLSPENLGVLPTPAINYCLSIDGNPADAPAEAPAATHTSQKPAEPALFAIDITASHNPYTYNGLKIFERRADHSEKLSIAGRAAVEAALASPAPQPGSARAPLAPPSSSARDAYLEHLRRYLGPCRLSGQSLAIDCANGATSVVGAALFEELGAKVTLINSDASYGEKINRDCGSTHLDPLQKVVRKQGLDYGVAFDGDGDRCLLVDAAGEVVDGDRILALLAEYLGLESFVVTVMANQGLLIWAKDHNINLEITDVGDQNVYARMLEQGITLGGEQSGHIILPGEPMGDGMLTALMLAKLLSEAAQPSETAGAALTRLAADIPVYPQVMLNIPATPAQKSRLTSAEIKSYLAETEKKLSAENGRLLVRPSGTEDLIRITVWGSAAEQTCASAEAIANHLKEIL